LLLCLAGCALICGTLRNILKTAFNEPRCFLNAVSQCEGSCTDQGQAAQLALVRMDAHAV
jgi:hypothetical protein